MSLLGWALFAVAVMSLGEYAAHRWPMHSARWARRLPFFRRGHEAHALLHHGRFFPGGLSPEGGDRADRAGRHVSVDLPPGMSLLYGLPLWGGLCLYSPAGGLTLAAVIFLHGCLWTAFHREMHESRFPWWSKNPLFALLARHHHQHHRRPDRNFGAVFGPLWDLIFRTRYRPS